MHEQRTESYGQQGATIVDRFGVWLSTRAILRQMPPQPADLLDIGCGYHAVQMGALGSRLRQGVGIDFQVDPKLKRLENMSFLEGDAEESLRQLEGREFDVVLMNSVLEHIFDAQGILSLCHQLLRPSGTLLVNVPTWLGKVFLECSAFRLGLSPKVEMDDHKMYYGKRDLWPLLVRAGFRPSAIHLKYHKFGLNLFASARKSPPA